MANVADDCLPYPTNCIGAPLHIGREAYSFNHCLSVARAMRDHSISKVLAGPISDLINDGVLRSTQQRALRVVLRILSSSA